MYEYFVANPLLALIFILIGILIIFYAIYKGLQKIGLERIRAAVYRAFVEAEHRFNQGDNTQKFEYVVQLARSSLPAPFSFFITENLLRKVVQLWFDLVKDLLDDGRVNGSQKGEE